MKLVKFDLVLNQKYFKPTNNWKLLSNAFSAICVFLTFHSIKLVFCFFDAHIFNLVAYEKRYESMK